jgi:hypothetical protein
MKKIFLIGALLLFAANSHAQIAFGIKAGANFSDTEGGVFASKMRTGFHAGAVLQLKYNNFAIQPELLYSMQGSEVTFLGVKEKIDLNYVTVPVLVKYYVLTDILSIDVGPQFAFLVDDNLDNTYKTKDYDFAVVGGLGLDIGKSLFAQAHYVIGLTDASTSAFTNAAIKNRVFQLSVGYKF